MTDEEDILAAEYALGLLDAGEAAVVETHMRTDAALLLRVAWWRDQLSPLVGELETPVPGRVWGRIAAQLPGNDNSATVIQRWRAAAISAFAIAAALVVFIAQRPNPLPVVQPPMVQAAAPMMAALAGEKGVVVAISYDAAKGRLLVAPTVLDAGKGDAELWVIPDGGQPHSLGLINAKSTEPYDVSAANRAFVQAGATLAITQENKGGSVTGLPSGPIVAAGKIIRT